MSATPSTRPTDDTIRLLLVCDVLLNKRGVCSTPGRDLARERERATRHARRVGPGRNDGHAIAVNCGVDIEALKGGCNMQPKLVFRHESS